MEAETRCTSTAEEASSSHLKESDCKDASIIATENPEPCRFEESQARQSDRANETSRKNMNNSRKRKQVGSLVSQPKVYVFGNYDRYYGYRDPNFASDRRIELFERSWFESRRVLDIGCNEGNVALQIAAQFCPEKVVGIDIDPTLIDKAKRNVTKFARVRQLDATTRQRLCDKVRFEAENYVLDCDEQLASVGLGGEFDTILALSVTKWIQLNFGDAGLKRAFRRAFLQLSHGGLLILEPQTFASYKKYKRLSAITAKNYSEIRFKPDQFCDYLLSSEIGFVSCRRLESATNTHKGFCRPIFVFRKAASADC